MHCISYLTAVLVLLNAQAMQVDVDSVVESVWPAASGTTTATDVRNIIVANEWFKGISLDGDGTCSVEDECIVGSGLGDCKVMVDPAMAIPLGSTDAGNACDIVFNRTLQYRRAARFSTPVSNITIAGYSPSSHWNLCWAKDAKGIDRRDFRRTGVEDYCYYVNGLCFLWASPCSGGCSQLHAHSSYSSFCPGLRYATSSEWYAALPILIADRDAFYSKCAASQLDPRWNHCDKSNHFARVEDNGWDDLVLVCGASATQASRGDQQASTPSPAPASQECAQSGPTGTGGPSMWPADCSCSSWAQGDSAVSWSQGTGYAGNETYVGVAASCAACLHLVLSTYPMAAGATFRTPGSSTRAGECYVEHLWLYPNGDPDWITIPLRFTIHPGTGGGPPPSGSTSITGMEPIIVQTTSPTPSPALSPTSASSPLAPITGASGSVAATGDPHMENIHGERFDLMMPGKHILINIPRGELSEKALLRVEAEARQLGGQCADMYFQELNITGAWVGKNQTGGLRFQAQDASDRNLNWEDFGKVALKVAHGRTRSGTQYLNFYVKHLKRAGFVVGGLLGEDDHEDAAKPEEACVQRVSLLQNSPLTDQNASDFSVAEASLE